MFDLYFYSTEKLTAMFLSSIVIFVIHALYVGMLAFNKFSKDKSLLLGEFLLLLYFATISLTPIVASINRRYGIIDFSFSTSLLYILGVPTAIYFLVLCIRLSCKFIFPIVIIVFSLPFFSFLPYGYQGTLISVAYLIMFVRSLLLFSNTLGIQRNELSDFSIKEGLDTVPAGVMFCDLNGYIYLTNIAMQKLIMSVIGQEQVNGKLFWERLSSGALINAKRSYIDNDILLRVDNVSWRLCRRFFSVNKSEYTEIVATNVTKTVITLDMLEKDRQELLLQSQEIHALTEKMETLRREQEYSRIRSQVHDVMSQRLTAIQRLLQSHSHTDYPDILPILHDIVAQIKAKDSGSATELFDELCVYFGRMSLSIELIGALPSDEATAFLFLAILREACTNAAKHAGATKVFAKICATDDGCYNIQITNNGSAPKTGISEGGGLAGIRNRIENVGGSLKVEIFPEFALVITI